MSSVGHLKLRNKLREAVVIPTGATSLTIGMQFSSLSSLKIGFQAPNELFLAELARSMRYSRLYNAAKDTSDPPHDVNIIWPSCRTVGNSVLGYEIGNCIPLYSKNIRNSNGDYNPWFKACVRKWDGTPGGKNINAPHIKTFYRSFEGADGRIELLWCYLGSHNLSQAAWGVLEKNATQLYIKSYELGVLFLPAKTRTTTRAFSVTPSNPRLGINFASSSASTANDGTPAARFVVSFESSPRDCSMVCIPLPHRVPAAPYNWTVRNLDNKPWAWDLEILEGDRYGNTRNGQRFDH